jgi:hypothetical protein
MGKIEDIKINDISIGDNLLNHFSKLELIQNKKLLEVKSEQKQLFYISEVGRWSYYYESNERVGMTEKLNYRLIGFRGLVKCDNFNFQYKKDEIIDVMKDCIKNNEIKKHIHKIISYPFSTTESDEIEIRENGNLSFYVNYTSGGCYNNNVSIGVVSYEENSNSYIGPEIHIIIISKELDEILYSKYC